MKLFTCLFAIGVLAGSLSRLGAESDPPLEPLVRIRHLAAPHPLRQSIDPETGAFPLDLNDDGVVDYFSRVVGFGWKIQAAGNNRLGAVLKPPPDIGSFVSPFDEEEVIGDTPPEGVVWLDRNTPNQSAPGESTLNSCTNIGCSGLFLRGFNYMAVHFEGENRRMHYGWVRINNPSGGPGGWFVDWAYDTREDVPIRAGAMPGEGLLALEPPRLLGDDFAGGGHILLTLSGQVGTETTIYKSTDLTVWTPWITVTSPFPAITSPLPGESNIFFKLIPDTQSESEP